MTWKVVIFIILSVLLVIFTLQNQLLISIRFFHWEKNDVPLIYILLFGLIFGFSLALIMQLPLIIKMRRELRNVLRELENSEKIDPVKDEEDSSEGVSMGKEYKGGFFNEDQ
jgi:uncharacterized integral membrane protein